MHAWKKYIHWETGDDSTNNSKSSLYDINRDPPTSRNIEIRVETNIYSMIQRWRVRSNRKSSLSWHEYTAFCGYINTRSPAIRSMTPCFGVLVGNLKPLYCVLRSVSVSAVLVGSLKPETPLYCVLCSQTPNNYLLTSELFSSIQNFPTFWLEHQLKTFNLLNF